MPEYRCCRFERPVNEQVCYIVIACDHPGDEPVQRDRVGNQIFLRVNQSCGWFDVIPQFGSLFDTDDVPLGNLQRTVYKVDQSLCLSGPLDTDNQL